MSLLELARSFNIVETIKLNSGTLTNSKQIFKFLIVIDFEATCWNKGDAKWRQPEIIGNYIGEAGLLIYEAFYDLSLQNFLLF